MSGWMDRLYRPSGVPLMCGFENIRYTRMLFACRAVDLLDLGQFGNGRIQDGVHIRDAARLALARTAST